MAEVEVGKMSTSKVPSSRESPLRLDGVLRLDRCPQCGTAMPHLILKYLVDSPTPGNYDWWTYWAIYRCESCGNIVAAKSESKGHKNIKNNDTSFVTGELRNLPVSEVIPQQRVYDTSIPEKARAYLTQAQDSLHSPAGSVMLSASAVDAMLKAKGLTQGTRNHRIDEAVKQYLITEDMGKWGHQVRLDANDQRHADLNAPLPNREDAELCLDFAAALADLLFVLPARVTRGIKQSSASQGSSGP